MKKIRFAIIITCILVLLSGCDDSAQPDKNVSQLRFDIFCGQSETVKVEMFLESRENPMVLDGIANDSKNCVFVKLTIPDETQLKDYKISFVIKDKTYDCDFENNTTFVNNGVLVEIEEFPETKLDMTVTHLDKNEIIRLESIKKTNLMSYNEAYTLAKTEKVNLLSEFEENKIDFEIQIRFIVENDTCFWFIGFITEEKTHAILIDAEHGKIVAQKDLEN